MVGLFLDIPRDLTIARPQMTGNYRWGLNSAPIVKVYLKSISVTKIRESKEKHHVMLQKVNFTNDNKNCTLGQFAHKLGQMSPKKLIVISLIIS